jgi:hypothetical protein
MNMGTALMLGQAGMSLAQASSSSGARPTKKVPLSAQGKKLEASLRPAVKEQYDKAIAGNVSDKAFGAISQAKTQEGQRNRSATGMLQKAQASMNNQSLGSRGSAATGGNLMRGQLADTGQRMEGLFAETSILNNYSKEALMNSVAQIQNWQNRENVVAQFTSQSNLADWTASNVASARQGAAIGQAARSLGGAYAMNQYGNQQQQIRNNYNNSVA